MHEEGAEGNDMAGTGHSGKTTNQTGATREALPLAVLTITIDKKRLTPALYKQLAEEDVIDEETGELHGMAVGWFNLHPKEGCPNVTHKHVLWGNGTHLALSTVVAQEHDPRYQQKEQFSQRRRREIIHLLALLLACADQLYTLHATTNHQQQLDITGYKLYVDSWVGTLLERYQQAKTQVQEDEAALQASMEVTTDNHDGPVPSDWRTQAQQTLQRLTEQGIVLTHPNLYKHEQEHYAAVYGAYGHDLSWYNQTITERRTGGWKAYPKDLANEPDKALLYWKKERGQSGLDTSTVATIPEPHVLPLRVIIAERLTAQATHRLQEAAQELAQNLNLSPSRKKGTQSATDLSALDPSTVWKHYEQEKKQFEAYAQLWKEHLEGIQALEQLFLV